VRDGRGGHDAPHSGGHLNDLDAGGTQERRVAAGVEYEGANAIRLPIMVADPGASPRVPVAGNCRIAATIAAANVDDPW
jgi:hypothetical protein